MIGVNALVQFEQVVMVNDDTVQDLFIKFLDIYKQNSST